MNLFDIGYILLGGLSAPLWARKSRGDWAGRFGKGPALPAPGSRPRILLHAVSVGEVNALRTLVPWLSERADVVVSVGTDTGIARAREIFACEVVRYPLDASWMVKRFLRRIQPRAVGLVELEVWPNFVRACAAGGIPVAVINGRLSARSFRGYRRARTAIGPTFRRLALAAVQDEAYAARFRAMGVERVVVTGTMKWDAARMEDEVAGAETLALELGIDRSRPLIVGGSTAEDEEVLLHAACPKGVQLLCAPRKPEHFDEAARAMPGCVRRSERRAGRGADRFVLDTIGELRQAYALADVVVVGRSFGSLHGSDPIEPAAVGRATVIGPRFEDFENVVTPLRACGGLIVSGREELGEVLAGLIGDEGRRAAIGKAARECVRMHQGASVRHGEILMGLAGGAGVMD